MHHVQKCAVVLMIVVFTSSASHSKICSSINNGGFCFVFTSSSSCLKMCSCINDAFILNLVCFDVFSHLSFSFYLECITFEDAQLQTEIEFEFPRCPQIL